MDVHRLERPFAVAIARRRRPAPVPVRHGLDGLGRAFADAAARHSRVPRQGRGRDAAAGENTLAPVLDDAPGGSADRAVPRRAAAAPNSLRLATGLLDI